MKDENALLKGPPSDREARLSSPQGIFLLIFLRNSLIIIIIIIVTVNVLRLYESSRRPIGTIK